MTNQSIGRQLLLSVLLLVLAVLPARAASLAEVIRAVEAPFSEGRIRDYSAAFTQEAYLAALDRRQGASGDVQVRFAAAPGQAPTVMFRWQYRQPTVQELVSDGRTLWVYVADNQQVIVSPVAAAGARDNDPLAFLTGLGNLSRDFTISFADPERDDEGNYRLDLRPRRPSTVLARMVIVVAREALTARGATPLFPVVSATVVDPGDNRTTIHFGQVRVNRGLPPGQFTFAIPAGVEVVRP